MAATGIQPREYRLQSGPLRPSVSRDRLAHHSQARVWSEAPQTSSRQCFCTLAFFFAETRHPGRNHRSQFSKGTAKNRGVTSMSSGPLPHRAPPSTPPSISKGPLARRSPGAPPQARMWSEAPQAPSCQRFCTLAFCLQRDGLQNSHYTAADAPKNGSKTQERQPFFLQLH